MIVSTAHRYTYICPPKTGTGAVRRYLMKHFPGAFHPDQYHRADYEAPDSDWCVFATVRNPYVRLLSFWWFETVSRRVAHPNPQVGMSFAKYVRWLRDNQDASDYYKNPYMQHVRLPMHIFLSMSKPTHVVRLEHLMREFQALPFVNKPCAAIPHYRRKAEKGPSWQIGARTWLDRYDQESLDAANEFGAALEAERFGYRPVFDKAKARHEVEGDPSPIGPALLKWPL